MRSSTLGDPRRLLGALMSRPQRRYRSGGAAGGFTLRPNAPRMITCVGAVVLTVVGLAVTVLPIDIVTQQLTEWGIVLGQREGWIALLASPLLLIAGSFMRGL